MKDKETIIHVAIAFDEGYITPVFVLLTSIFLNNKECQIIVHAIATDVSEKTKDEIIAYCRHQENEAYFYEVNQDAMRNFPVPDSKEAYITLATYYRLFFPIIISDNIKTLLYIDVDTLVLGNLKQLYQSDIGNFVIGAVMEAEMPPRPEIGILNIENYFNAGILLIDLEKWRKQHITEQALNIITTQPHQLQYHDQDALNIIFNGKWHRLEKKYNLMKAYIPCDLAKADYFTFLLDKIIIHYNGRNKPWHRACENKFRFLYLKYLKASPRSYDSRYMKKKITKEGLVKLAYSRVLEVYFNYPTIGLFWRKIKSPFR
jgi:lipopolysaccharide biosynthesis glycosyltransferase